MRMEVKAGRRRLPYTTESLRRTFAASKPFTRNNNNGIPALRRNLKKWHRYNFPYNP